MNKNIPSSGLEVGGSLRSTRLHPSHCLVASGAVAQSKCALGLRSQRKVLKILQMCLYIIKCRHEQTDREQVSVLLPLLFMSASPAAADMRL